MNVDIIFLLLLPFNAVFEIEAKNAVEKVQSQLKSANELPLNDQEPRKDNRL